jgi:hypothetical protein
MNIVLSFAPFIAFFALLRLVSPVAGLVAALVVSALLCARMWRRKEKIKVLEIGSLVLFTALVAYTLVFAPVWTIATVRLAVDAGLLAIVLVSLAIGRPFTLQYAREEVPEHLWTSPVFLRANRIITSVWALAFAVLVAADAAAEYAPAIPLWIDVAASVVALLGAIRFTIWYPASLRERWKLAEGRSG